MTTAASVTVPLNNGIAMPQLGFGVFQVPPPDTEEAVSTALAAGYRSLDTAAAYQNEAGVGAAIGASEIPRDELFVTTKLWNTDHGYDMALRAFDRSLSELGLDYLDLYLIHWPAPGKGAYVETWRALERVYADGGARAIGVSNFNEPHLRRVLDEGEVVPAVNQIELHPLLQQAPMRAFDAAHGILTEAWSPLAKGELLRDPTITRLARRHGKTPAQVVLRWHLELGNVVIPKSVTPTRIIENIDVFDFELTDADLGEMERLDAGTRTGPDPDTLG